MSASDKIKIAVAGLSLSAAAFIGLVSHEGYTDQAVIPTKNDRPTMGFGSTFHPDGRPVRMGERVDPVRALVIAQAHISKEEKIFRDSLQGAKLSQAEFDIYMDWVYQYGTGAWARSSMRRHVLANEHKEACEALLRYRFAGGYDCSTTINGQPNKRCWGVWTRQLERHQKCIAAQ
jgi:lysozyme